ncbi:MAG: endopeptidase La [SAR202 cluster bacterium Io17-Chloro-G3]|nr:MAG: endopeptidase La [SAR202 cluster bacterium Io17-Chloro-G3]
MPKKTEQSSSKKDLQKIPLLVRRNTIAFPKLVTQVMVMRANAQRALEHALEGNRKIVVVGRRNTRKRNYTAKDLYPMGTLATVGRMLKLPDGSSTVWLQGEQRVNLLDVVQTEPFFMAKVEPAEETVTDNLTVQALKRAVLALFEKAIELSPSLTDEMYIAAMNADSPGWLADLIASSLILEMKEHQKILQTLDIEKRLHVVNLHLAHEVEVLEIQTRINKQVQEELERTQREHILREQLRVIQKELGEVDPQFNEAQSLEDRIRNAHMPKQVSKKALEELSRLGHIPTASPENGVIRGYIDWLLSLPWKASTRDTLNIQEAARTLEQNHYGLPKVKERILEYLAVRKLAGKKLRSPVLCFIGPPGVGKTSLGKSIAKALGRKFVHISLGGIRDEAEIRGHRRTYVSALPGRIIQAMRNAETVNPVFMLDEIDKVGTDFRGDPSSALLEALDPEQNHSFSDHYLEVPYDLSRVLFITTGNILDPIIPALRDRMEIIELPGYTEEEKVEIANRFLIPNQLREHGLSRKQLSFAANTVQRIAREYTREAGVRNLEREIGSVCRKVARKVAEERKISPKISPQLLSKYLGAPHFSWGTAEQHDEIGVATGVARTEAGGDVLAVEATLVEGKGDLILTGQLGDVMKESAQAALSYSRSRSREWELSQEFFKSQDIHIHIPAGAIPKDGPSAGVTMTTALISILSKRAVRKEVAMTGEITLRGKVLPVGGIKEKVLAAHRAGITTFVLPKDNKGDLEEIPAKVRKSFNFVLVERIDEVLSTALCP